ncbi:LytTr DNA-binding domain protein [Faecalibacterium prausnitzii M21/2]|uniref:Stage 0 sporulation protein A homolog n=2 Tax=Faecalibacterium prausnitzii TaxID=853 RepID=A8S9B3_9FIRM|nr:LytTr DNA-binding domain protein [Faecalibacterium prausnitzii M21/2]
MVFHRWAGILLCLFGHKNTPGGCSVFYAVYSGGRIASAARQLPEADTVLLKKHFLALLLRRAAALPGDELVRHDDLCGQKVRVLDVVDGLAGSLHAQLVGVDVHGGQLWAALPFVAECPLANRTGLRYNRAITVPQRCGKGGAVMIRVAVVEDDAEVQGVLQEYIRRYTRQYGTEFEVSVFADGVDILEDYRAVYDVIFLDVEMKHLDGMTTAERIRQMDADVILIFITNMAQYAIRGYSVGALDYVLKPVPYFAFSEQLKKAEKNLARRASHYLMVPVESGLRRLDSSRLYYLESEGHRVHYYTEDGDFSAPGTLKAVEEKLAGRPFARCNSGYLVNLAQVQAVQQNTVQVGPYELQISRPKRKAFLAALTDYIGGEGS